MPGIVLKTILSRVVIFKFSLLEKKEIKKFIEGLNVRSQKPKEDKILDLSLGRPGVAREMIVDKKKISYYISLLEAMERIPRLSVFNRLALAEKLEKENNFADDFLLLVKFWLRDLLLSKEENQDISFSFKKTEIEKTAKDFSKEKIEEALGEVQKTQKYFMFSNASRLLALENFLLTI